MKLLKFTCTTIRCKNIFTTHLDFRIMIKCSNSDDQNNGQMELWEKFYFGKQLCCFQIIYRFVFTFFSKKEDKLPILMYIILEDNGLKR